MGLTAQDAWREIVDGEIDAASPITQELIAKYLQNQRAVVEGPCGGRWLAVATNKDLDKRFIRVFVPRGAHGIEIECQAGLSAGSPPGTPYIQLNISDGATTSYGGLVSMKQADGVTNIVYATRIRFPPIPIPVTLRNRMCDANMHIQDAAGSNAFFTIANYPFNLTDATFGFGVRFG